MLHYSTNKKGVQIIQDATAPRIYLDYCVLRRFSDSHPGEGEQFLDILKKTGGTLYFSWMLLIESYNQGTGRAYRRLLNFLKRIGPYWGFLDCEYIKVVEKEKQWSHRKQGPQVDETMLKEIFLQWIRHHNCLIKRLYPILLWFRLLKFTPKSLFDELKRCPEDYVKYKELAESTKTNMKSIIDNARKSVRNNTTARNNMEKIVPLYTQGTPPTEYIYKQIHKLIILGNDNFEPNDGPDLMHSTVASAYSEFVVLDKKWASRLKSIEVPDCAAKIYGINELDQFLEDLAAYGPSHISTGFHADR